MSWSQLSICFCICWASLSVQAMASGFPLERQAESKEIGVAGTKGDVYRIGYKTEFGIAEAITVEKISRAGFSQWNASLPFQGLDEPLKAIVDSNDDLIVIGGHTNPTIWKISASGLTRWSQSFVEVPAEIHSIAVDKNNNIYLLTRAHGNGDLTNSMTRKFTSDGVLLWEREFDSGAGDFPKQLEVTPDGHVYAHLIALNGYRSLLLHYDSDGTLLSERLEFPESLGFDRVVIGRFILTPDGAIVVSALNELGGQVGFVARFSSPNMFEWLRIQDILAADVLSMNYPLVACGADEVHLLHPDTFKYKAITSITSSGKMTSHNRLSAYDLFGDARTAFGTIEMACVQDRLELLAEVYPYGKTEVNFVHLHPKTQGFHIEQTVLSLARTGWHQFVSFTHNNGFLYSMISRETSRNGDASITYLDLLK